MARIALLFPGQGAQRVGMGADFVREHPSARELFQRADDVLGRPLSRLCLEGPEDQLTLTENCQPAIYLTSAAIVGVLESEGLVARDDVIACAGLSLGEYTALWYAGVFDFDDGLRLVARRGAAMQAASDEPPSGMLALLGADRATAEEVARRAAEDDVLCVANVLAPGNVVLSGAATAIARAQTAAKELGVKRAIPLNVAGAFHSALMSPAADELRAALADVRFSAPRMPVVGNVDGLSTRDPEMIRRNLEAQVVEPVLWEPSMRALLGIGVRRFVEPGPGKVLSGLLKKIDRDADCTSYDTTADLDRSSGDTPG